MEKKLNKINYHKISNVLLIVSLALNAGQFLLYFQTKYNLDNPLVPSEKILLELMHTIAVKGMISLGLLSIGLIFYFYKKHQVTFGLLILNILFMLIY
jgi:hypothetical protein